MPQIANGQRMIGFSSWTDAESELDAFGSELEFVLYNPEHWENTPADEQENLPAIVRDAAETLHARNISLFIAPDRKFTDENLDDLAHYADGIMLQGQRLQDDPALFASWITEKIDVARAANPDTFIFVQVGATRDTPEQMMLAIQTVSDKIDGVAVWSTPYSFDALRTFVKLLRETPRGSPSSTPISPTPGLSTPSELSAITKTLVPASTNASPTLSNMPSPVAMFETSVVTQTPLAVSAMSVPPSTNPNRLVILQISGMVLALLIILSLWLLIGKWGKSEQRD
jgi:hypothetical protein